MGIPVSWIVTYYGFKRQNYVNIKWKDQKPYVYFIGLWSWVSVISVITIIILTKPFNKKEQ